MDTLSNPHTMQHLAQLLGASDYLWEDFIRLQYETLFPILSPTESRSPMIQPVETLPQRLGEVVDSAEGFDAKKKALNDFKNKEIFLFDLDHILNPNTDFRVLAERLTKLAEAVIEKTSQVVYSQLVKDYGSPQTVAGLGTTFSICGLGKLGGAALGYASDVELLVVYSDQGKTDGPHRLENGEFFSRFTLQLCQFIEAKREGIFDVDLRLRPYGESGPPSCSLQSFCTYYAKDGPAHSYEKLALVRLRPIAGNVELGRKIKRLRDSFIYTSNSIEIKELRDLRRKQFQEKNRPGLFNAKFSPGALVDLEYAVQLLQVINSQKDAALRTPRIHKALEALGKIGVLEHYEVSLLNDAYSFLRSLINGLRMLRGSAHDLFLPDVASDECLHLARRMGYVRKEQREPSDLLYLDFQTQTAAVRTFVQRHFGQDSIPGPNTGNIADLILSDNFSDQLRDQMLQEAGFEDLGRAQVNLKKMAGDGLQRGRFAKLALLAIDVLKHVPNPDMALNNWERFVDILRDPTAFYEELLAQPTRLDILLCIFSRSQFLANTLARNPSLWDWITDPEILHKHMTKQNLVQELRDTAAAPTQPDMWLDQIRRFRQRELLRIGTKDMYLGVSLQCIMRELSDLADAVLQVALEVIWRERERSRPFYTSGDGTGFLRPRLWQTRREGTQL